MGVWPPPNRQLSQAQEKVRAGGGEDGARGEERGRTEGRMSLWKTKDKKRGLSTAGNAIHLGGMGEENV